MKRLLSPRGACWLLLVAGFLCGCSKDGTTVVPVRGKVTVDGQPVTSGQVSCLPISETQSGKLSAGQIDASGEYKIFTAGKEGAPPGKYKVTVTPSMVPTGGKSMPTTPFNPRFTSVQSTTLQIEVVSNAAAGAYDLKLTK